MWKIWEQIQLIQIHCEFTWIKAYIQLPKVKWGRMMLSSLLHRCVFIGASDVVQ